MGRGSKPEQEELMKIVVYGPDRRTGALRDGSVVDLSGAFAKFAAERAARRIRLNWPRRWSPPTWRA
jgi:hypothetical protein